MCLARPKPIVCAAFCLRLAHSMGCGALTAGIAALHLAAGGTPTTIIGTEVPFYPYTQVDEAGEITGLDRDIADEVCLRADLKCAWIATQFDQLIPGLHTGAYDIIMGGIAITDARRQRVDFTLPYMESGSSSSYLGRPGAPAIDDATTAVQSGTIQEQHLSDTGRRYIALPNEAAVIDALVQGRADLALGAFNSATTDRLIAEEGYDFLYSEDIFDDGTAMAVCKGNADLLEKLDAALQAMIDDGTLDEISAQW